MADRTEEIINQQSGGNTGEQLPTRNVAINEPHADHATGTLEFAGKTYKIGSGLGSHTFPSTAPGRFALTGFEGRPGSETVSVDDKGNPTHKGIEGIAISSSVTKTPFRIGGTEPITGDPATKGRSKALGGEDRTNEEVHTLHLHEGMPDKDLTQGCIGLVGHEHYKELEKDLKEAWARGDNTAVEVHYSKDGKTITAKVDRMSSHPDYSGEGSLHKGPIGEHPQEDTKPHASDNVTQSAHKDPEKPVEKPQDTKTTSGGNQTATGKPPDSEGGGGPMARAPYPEGKEYAGKVREIESGGDDKNITGPNVGRYQFSKDQFAGIGIRPDHKFDPEDQDRGLYNQNQQITQKWRETHNGENPTPAQMYQMHQQGITGTAAIHDPKNKDRPANEVVSEAMGYSKDKAKEAIMAQTGSKDIAGGKMPTAGQFAEHWNNLYKNTPEYKEEVTKTQSGSNATLKEKDKSAQPFIDKYLHQDIKIEKKPTNDKVKSPDPKSNPTATDKRSDSTNTDKQELKRLSDTKKLQEAKVAPGPNPANPYMNTHEFEYAVVSSSGATDKTKQQRVQISPQSMAGVESQSLPYAKTHMAHTQEAPTWKSPHSYKNGNIVKVRKDPQSGEWEILGNPGTVNA